MKKFDTALFAKTLKSALESLDLVASVEAQSKMAWFAQEIVAASSVMNLTSVLEPREMAIKHFADSLTPLVMSWPDSLKCLDVGTGAGFPGVPLALACPNWNFVLLDSIRKRTRFLERASMELGSNLTVVTARAEEAGRDAEHREQYDLVVSRAVAPLAVLLELCTPFVRIGGHFVAYKAVEATRELKASERAIDILQVELEQSLALQLPEAQGERVLLLFRKTSSTPQAFPRRTGLPKKTPLM